MCFDCLTNFVEIPSNPMLFLGFSLSMILAIVSSSTFLNLNLLLHTLFRNDLWYLFIGGCI